ncbi:hypothetical protein C7999DRAFT_18512 [Corynascus novoguineensis]|uniref:BZIP domain-containing protein n=1 Tax=Corynascus novoguineensis TaxID=1126955 RepID=A0AAN7HIE3_9PEZI|nr:hypothetical protein C7999DRAFT_18512 [Corynascus novoguineensis]
MEPVSYRTRLHKFSCKPPGHDAARQRENQRRHRARVKNRIAELEASLSSAQSRLNDALKRIESLTAEVERLQHTLGSGSTMSIQTTTQQQPVLGPATYSERGVFDRAENDRTTDQTLSALDACPRAGDFPTLTTTIYREASVVNPEPIPSGTQEPRSTSPQPLDKLPANNLPASGFEDPNNDWALLPPPSVGESTIPCREAYSIIKDRSSPEFDLSTATEWLKPGFRRAVIPGTGCRVQTHILFAFVDYITSI